MRPYLRLLFAILILPFSLEVWSQPCNGTPTVNSATAANVTAISAVLGGNVTGEGGGSCDVIETGIEWATSLGGPYTKVVGSETGPGTFTVNVPGLPSATR